MLSELRQSTLVFFSYAQSHKDKKLRDKLVAHLSILKHRGLISTWHDQDILAGEVWNQQMSRHLEQAHVILLLISADFLASNYCYGVQMKRALERHERGEASVIPILLRPVHYKEAPFAKLQILPSNKKPITKWRDPDDAFMNIACSLEKIAGKYRQPAPTKPLTRLLILMRYVYEFPRMGWLGWLGWVIVLILLQALLASHASGGGATPSSTSLAILGLFILLASFLTVRGIRNHWKQRGKRMYYEKALSAYQQALVHDPSNGAIYQGIGNAFSALRRYDEAFDAFQQAIHFGPTPPAYAELGKVCTKLKQHDQAVTAFEKALALDSTVTFDQKSFGQSLQAIGKKQDAKQVLKQFDEDFC